MGLDLIRHGPESSLPAVTASPAVSPIKTRARVSRRFFRSNRVNRCSVVIIWFFLSSEMCNRSRETIPLGHVAIDDPQISQIFAEGEKGGGNGGRSLISQPFSVEYLRNLRIELVFSTGPRARMTIPCERLQDRCRLPVGGPGRVRGHFILTAHGTRSPGHPRACQNPPVSRGDRPDWREFRDFVSISRREDEKSEPRIHAEEWVHSCQRSFAFIRGFSPFLSPRRERAGDFPAVGAVAFFAGAISQSRSRRSGAFLWRRVGVGTAALSPHFLPFRRRSADADESR